MLQNIKVIDTQMMEDIKQTISKQKIIKLGKFRSQKD